MMMGTWMIGSRNRNEIDERMSWRWQQLVQLAATMRATDDMSRLLERLANTLTSIIGFESATLLYAPPTSATMTGIGVAGMADEDYARIMAASFTRQAALDLLKPEDALRPGLAYRLHPAEAHLVSAITRQRASAVSVGQRATGWTDLDTLLIPLRDHVDETLIGLLVLDTPTNPRGLQNGALQGTLDLLESCAEIIVMALENAQIYQESVLRQTQTEQNVAIIRRQFELVQQGDFTASIDGTDSSFGVIAALFDALLRRVSSTLASVRSASQVINESGAAVWALANDAMRNAQSQVQQIDHAATKINGVATSIDDMAQVSETAWTVAGNAREFSQAGRISVEDAVMGMDGVRQVALQASQRVKRLAESLQEIETIVQQVSDFSAKTNLLAINSSIEATRAGDFGRGFAIIAQEIRTLALNSADAAHQIATRIKTIQSEAAAVVTAIAESTERVVEQSDRIVDAGAALLVIDEVIEQIATLNESIHTIAHEESSQAMTLTATMQEILLITETTCDRVQQIGAAMSTVVDFAAALTERIGQLKLRDDLER